MSHLKISEDTFVCSPTLNMSGPQYHGIKRQIFRDPGNCIEYSTHLARFIQKELSKAMASRNPFEYDPILTGDPSVDGEVKRFIVAIASYLDPRSKPRLEYQVLHDGIMNKNFASDLKKIRFKSYVRSMGGRFCEPDPELEEYPTVIIHDIGQIFNYRYWIFWSEEDPGDEKWCDLPCPPLEEDIITEYSDTLFRLLPDEIQEVDEREILFGVTSSSAESNIMGKGKSSPHYIEKTVSKFNTCSNEPLSAKLVYVQKCPGDTRRASVLTIQHSNAIKLVEKQVAIVAEAIEHSNYTANKDEFDRRYRALEKDFNWYLCRDIKKDGLTKNRELLVLTMKILARKYPHIPTFSRFTSLFSNWTYYLSEDPDTVINPPRGIGLGMSCALTTLIGCTLIQVVLDRAAKDGGMHLTYARGLVYHDDTAVGFEDEESLDAFDEVEDDVFADYRLIKNKKKSFYGPEFVLCERYTGRFDNKCSYQMYLIHSPYYACNIVHAKDMLQQIVRFKTDFDIMQFLSGYSSYWGYELHPGELCKPYRLGGWLPAVYMGVDTTFLWFDQTPEDKASMHACSSHTLERPVKKAFLNNKNIYQSPLRAALGPNLNLGGNEDIYNYNITMGGAYRRFSNFNKPGSICWSYALLLRKRQTMFETFKHVNLQQSETQFYQMWCQFLPYVDFLPKDSWFEHKDIEEFRSDDPVFDLFPYKNKFLGYIKFCNPEKNLFDDVIPWPVPPSLNVSEKTLSAEDRKLSVRIPVAIGGTYSILPQNYLQLRKTYDFSQLQWIHPERVALAHQANYFTPVIPVPPFRIPQKDEITAYRCSHFNVWMNKTPFRTLFIHLVRKLGWKTMGKIELFDDEVYTDHIWGVLPELKRPAGTTPETIALPPPDDEEYMFFFPDVHNQIHAYLSASFETYNPLPSDRGEDEGSEASSDDLADYKWRALKDDYDISDTNDSEYGIGITYKPAKSHRESVDGSTYTTGSSGDSDLSCEDPFEGLHQDPPPGSDGSI